MPDFHDARSVLQQHYTTALAHVDQAILALSKTVLFQQSKAVVAAIAGAVGVSKSFLVGALFGAGLLIILRRLYKARRLRRRLAQAASGCRWRKASFQRHRRSTSWVCLNSSATAVTFNARPPRTCQRLNRETQL